MSKKWRKPPEAPHHFWLGQDGCWFCKNQNNCNRCRVVIKAINEGKQRRERHKNKIKLKGQEDD